MHVRVSRTRSLLLVVSLAGACVGDHVEGPIESVAVASGRPSGQLTAVDQTSRRASLEQQIAAMNSLVAPHGGLDQLLNHGADTALIAERREHVENELPTLQRELRAIRTVSLERTDVSKGSPTVPDQPLKHEAYVGEVPASQAPACLYILGLNDCFLDWYSTVDYHGSGTVYEWTAGVFHHNTSTTIWDNGSQIGIPKTTANFGLQPTWSASYSFSPSDPNCF